MPIAGAQAATTDARRLEAGPLLTGAGAILLVISLFLEWYEPGLDAWTSFEVWDLVLAALVIAALVAVAGRMGFGRPRPNSWLLVPSAVASVVVVAAIVNHPPAAGGVGNDPMTGIWLALAGTALMLAGTVLTVARISVAVNVGDPPGPAAVRDRFGRSAGTAVDPDYPPPPRAGTGGTIPPPRAGTGDTIPPPRPGTGDTTPPPRAGLGGTTPPPRAGTGDTTPTEPTRRL